LSCRPWPICTRLRAGRTRRSSAARWSRTAEPRPARPSPASRRKISVRGTISSLARTRLLPHRPPHARYGGGGPPWPSPGRGAIGSRYDLSRLELHVVVAVAVGKQLPQFRDVDGDGTGSGLHDPCLRPLHLLGAGQEGEQLRLRDHHDPVPVAADHVHGLHAHPAADDRPLRHPQALLRPAAPSPTHGRACAPPQLP
jgi:hypothetical protein